MINDLHNILKELANEYQGEKKPPRDYHFFVIKNLIDKGYNGYDISHCTNQFKIFSGTLEFWNYCIDYLEKNNLGKKISDCTEEIQFFEKEK